MMEKSRKKLPAGWEMKTLDQIANNLDSRRIPITKNIRNNGKYPYYGASGIVDYVGDYIFDEDLLLISEDGANLLARTYPIAFSIKGKSWVNNHAHVLKFNNESTQNFVEYYLNSIKLDDFISGMAQPKLNQKMLNSIPIPYPKIKFQQRIVAKLDEAFAEIAAAKSNIERNLQNCKEVFQSELNAVFANKGKDWNLKQLGDLSEVIGGYSFKSEDFKKEGKYQVIRMGNVRPGVIREIEKPVYIDKIDDKTLNRALLLPNDVIITQTGTRYKRDYGFTVIIEKDNYLLNQRISAIRFTKDYLSKFFLYFSWTDYFRNQYFANESGTVGQGNVGINAIIEAKVPILNIDKQQLIVEKLDAFSAQCKQLEKGYQQKLFSLEELKKSILQKAFSGEL